MHHCQPPALLTTETQKMTMMVDRTRLFSIRNTHTHPHTHTHTQTEATVSGRSLELKEASFAAFRFD